MSPARPEPCWFGEPRPRSFGMLHRPSTPNGRAVVLCNSIGFEGSLAYRPFRHLADRLATGGFTVLRLDYPGTGDAAGGPWEPAQLDAWLAAVADAVALVRALPGVDDVQLAGFRMGAALALMHADAHHDVSGLALWSPCSSGKSFTRELVAMARLSSAHRPAQRASADWFPTGALEAVGFEFTAETLDELRSIDLRAPRSVAPAPAALVLDRDDAPESSDLIESLEAAGTKVDHECYAGYLEFITDDETSSVPPDAVLDRMIEWLGSTAPAAAAEPSHRVSVTDELTVRDAHDGHMFPPAAVSAPVVERPIWIANRCFGVIDGPAEPSPVARRVVLVLNTGSMRCSGPGGLHVVLGRHLASLGFTVIRVDLGGAGDTLADDPASENKPYDPSRLTDVAEIVEWIRGQVPCDELTLLGICSGAYNAFRGAFDGAPVDRVVLVNQLIFSLGGLDVSESDDAAMVSAGRLSRALGNRDRWKRVLKGEESVGDAVARFRGLMSDGAASGFRQMVAATTRNVAGKVGIGPKAGHDLARELTALAERGIDVVMVFAAEEVGLRYVRLMGGSVVDALVASGHVKIIEIDGGDHVFSPPGARQHLIEAMTELLLDSADEVPPLAESSPTKDVISGS